MKSTQAYFVQKMLAAILNEWPEWKSHLKTMHHSSVKGTWFIIPAPNPDVIRGLTPSIVQRRVIVGFDDDHDHLDQKKSESLPQFRKRVLARIRELTEDKIFAISWRDKEGRLRVSECFVAEFSSRFVQRGYTRRIRSWSGKHDQDFIEP